MKAQLDENLPPALARALNALAAVDGHQVIHVTDYAKGTPDVELFRLAVADGVKIHITADHHHRRPAERAAIIRLGLTVFVLSKGWQTMKYYDKAARLIEYWPTIVSATELLASGSLFRVQHRRNGRLEQIRNA